MEWYKYPNNNRPVMLDIDGRGYNLNSIHPDLLNRDTQNAYMVYNTAIRPPGDDWVGKTTYIPIGSDPALSNSHDYNGDQRRLASVEKDGSPPGNSCRVKRDYIYTYCHRELDRPGHICTNLDKDDRLLQKHNRWMNCRNIRAAFQNSNCRVAANSLEWVDPSDNGHIQRIKLSASEAEKCVNIYNDPKRVEKRAERRAFEAGEDPQVPPPVPIVSSAASSVHSKLRQRIAPPLSASASAASSVQRQPIAPPLSVAASAASSVQPKKILRSSIPPPAAASAASSVQPHLTFKQRVAAALVKPKPNKFLSKRKKSKTKSKTKSKKKSKKSKKKSIRRR